MVESSYGIGTKREQIMRHREKPQLNATLIRPSLPVLRARYGWGWWDAEICKHRCAS